MSSTTQGQRTGPRDRMVLGVILVIIGFGGLALQLLEAQTDIGGWIVAIIGLGLLGAFVYTHHYGYLVPAGIMTGLGIGIVLSEALPLSGEETGGVITLGLGLGSASIWVIGGILRVAEHHWWPLIPGGILAIVGGALLLGGQAVEVLDYWWVVLIVVGVVVMWRSLFEGGTRE